MHDYNNLLIQPETKREEISHKKINIDTHFFQTI
jgi:hypothetical protein